MATSKNQRTGRRSKNKKSYCTKGHELTDVLYVPAAGRARMRKVCECNGYAPMDNAAPKRQ
jgi:hypothetical protein